MAWDKLIGLHKEKRLFQTAILNNKLANTYCFIGTHGIGKDGFALEFAKTVNCYNPIKVVATDINGASFSSISACDECKSCKLADSFSHPNIQLVFAMPGKDKITESISTVIKEQIALKQADIYHKISVDKASEIQIDQIRSIKKSNAFDTEIGRKFIIISDCEKMNIQAANAFLKTLEEPSLNSTIIITTSKKEKLLDTILSRCQQIFFNSPALEEISNYIHKRYNRSITDSNLLASLSQGSVTRAVQNINDDMNALRSTCVDILRIALKRRIYRVELLNAIEEITTGPFGRNKEHIILIINILLIWLNDVLAISLVSDDALIVNTDLRERMIKFNNGFQHANLYEAMSIVEDAIAKVHSNVDPKLVLLSMFLSLRNVFLS